MRATLARLLFDLSSLSGVTHRRLVQHAFLSRVIRQGSSREPPDTRTDNYFCEPGHWQRVTRLSCWHDNDRTIRTISARFTSTIIRRFDVGTPRTQWRPRERCARSLSDSPIAAGNHELVSMAPFRVTSRAKRVFRRRADSDLLLFSSHRSITFFGIVFPGRSGISVESQRSLRPAKINSYGDDIYRPIIQNNSQADSCFFES